MEPETMQHPPADAPSRRGFLWWLTAGFSAVAAVVAGIPLIGYFLGARKPEKPWVPLGKVSLDPKEMDPNKQTFPVGETRLAKFVNPLATSWDGMTANTSVYVRNLGPDPKEKDPNKQKARFWVFAVNCAHLGCPVSWFPQSGLFMCPCHGGVYYADGKRASGPPPHGLFHCDWKVEKGQLWVQAPHYPTEQDPLVKDNKPKA
jgi:Rieske Fe-S protein